MVRRGTHKRQTGSEIYPAVHRHGFERSETLVVIHSQNSVKTGKLTRTEKSIARIGSVTAYFGSLTRFYSRDYFIDFLAAKQALLSCMGVERQYRNAGMVHAEIFFKRCLELLYLFYYPFLCN